MFSSGLAALNAIVCSELRAGDHIVCQSDAYGGTFDIFPMNCILTSYRFQLIDSLSEPLLRTTRKFAFQRNEPLSSDSERASRSRLLASRYARPPTARRRTHQSHSRTDLRTSYLLLIATRLQFLDSIRVAGDHRVADESADASGGHRRDQRVRAPGLSRSARCGRQHVRVALLSSAHSTQHNTTYSNIFLFLGIL